MSKTRKLGSLAIASLLPCLAGRAEAETLKAHYALSLMGISIGSAYASGVVDRTYRIDISMRTTGLANLVNNTKGAATASGGLSVAGPSPSAYANTTSNEEEVRTVRMSLASNAVRNVEVKPEPWDAEMRVPVLEPNKKRVVDPVSALIMSVPQGQELTGPAACNRTISVFDGVTRFDIALSFAGEHTANTPGYSGPVAICSARYTPIAGHRPDSKSTRYMAENRDMNVWLAPLPEARVVVPIHIDVKTGAGDLVIEASDFQIGAKRADSRR
ncbi:MAG: DUF3108 domain-containing protein [Methylocystis sp.]|uniref:DUF3108 domain-containing protein n=1 Tax=Methylocystis sp. TaxID=1911079 RepID=UPI003DA5D2A9